MPWYTPMGGNQLAIHYGHLAAKTTSGTISPSATLNTEGTEVAVVPSSGTSFTQLAKILVTWGGTFGAETATLSLRVNYSDGTVSDITPGAQTVTATATGTAFVSDTILTNLHKDGVLIQSVRGTLKSTIGASTANATVTVLGTQAV